MGAIRAKGALIAGGGVYKTMPLHLILFLEADLSARGAVHGAEVWAVN
jgi:hypothetical protein